MTELISEDFLRQLSEDVGRETMPVLQKAFAKGASKHIRTLQEAQPMTTEGLEKVSFHGHALKGMSQSLGLPALGELGAYLENSSKRMQKITPEPEEMTRFWNRSAEIIAVLDPLLIKSLESLQAWLDSTEAQG